ncbi:MAG: acetyl-CoA C-acyltransferase [Actinomycetia bacterium]|nr:acetyl-CoA C-acyltransferase [Actinomycetes bacterium]MCP4222900.1 acetyl-CoA C-acyltransferase [Actinomycetes bacterium]MCP5033924.1 acetyl-CoA C-acyltransferase [Actinomycetes bacterium]
MAASEAWIIDAVRSPRGVGKRDKGALSTIHPQKILGQVLNGLQDRVGFDPVDVEDVVCGNGSHAGDHAHDIGRMAVLDAGWPITVPGVTLNRFCGSGQQAVTFGAMGVAAGHQDLVIGCGVESMSRPARNGTDGFHANNEHLLQTHPQVPQGLSADLIATLDGRSREDCDAVGLESQRRAQVAIAEGRFSRSLIPIYHDDGSVALNEEEYPRPETTAEGLAALHPSFAKMLDFKMEQSDRSMAELVDQKYPGVTLNHVHHAGNSSGVVDGAGAVLLASPDYAKANGLKPRARILMSAVAGDEPLIMLTAPGPAALKCLAKAGMTIDDIDLMEVNEAFASVVLRFLSDTGADPEKVNVNGGAIALGHPIGATGSMLIGTVIDELERRDLQTGLVAMCTGGGMGTATIVERV